MNCSKKIRVLILAAGRGKRLESETNQNPKVMRDLCGKPLLAYVVDQISGIDKSDITIIAGYKREAVIEAFPEYSFAFQEEQKGTGHAVMCATDKFTGFDGDVLILSGDMPLITHKTIKNLYDFHVNNGNKCSILSIENPEESSFGRVIRNNGEFVGIVEKKDCDADQIKSTELNAGIYLFDSKLMFKCLKEVAPKNAQGEYYLTDVPKIMLSKGYKVDAYKIFDKTEALGVNTLDDLHFIEGILNCRQTANI